MINGRMIKVCGMRDSENITAVDRLGVDMMGFIFYPKSPRYVAVLPSNMPQHAKRVGVFVNESESVIESKIAEFGLDYVQLHGSESEAFCQRIASMGVRVIKAFSVDENFNFSAIDGYSDHCTLFIFDTKCSNYGGSGVQFDWHLLDRYMGTTPFLLSGGITPSNADTLNKFNHPYLAGYDLNSCFEISPAMKSVERLSDFLEQLKLKI